MRRGEVWRVSGLAGERIVLIVGNDSLADMYLSVQCVDVDTDRIARETLVTVRITHPVAGTALVAGAAPVLKKRFSECLGEVDEDTLERIAIALRAVYDLP